MKTSIIASLVLIVAAGPAVAAPVGPDVSTEVRTDDLDLASPADRQRLDQRVARAARQLCAVQTRSLAAMDFEKTCVALAMKRAAPQIDFAVAKASTAVRIATLAPSRGS
jgi:UrcA family protein